MHDVLPEISDLIGQCRLLEKQARQHMEERLPRGRVVMFRFGNMTEDCDAVVLHTCTFSFPRIEVLIRNLSTGKERRIPWSAITAITPAHFEV